MEKTPEPMHPTKNLGGGKFISYYEKPAQPDYKGVIRGGRAVAFEAKYTTTGRMEQDRVTSEQAERLDKYFASELMRLSWPVLETMLYTASLGVSGKT